MAAGKSPPAIRLAGAANAYRASMGGPPEPSATNMLAPGPTPTATANETRPLASCSAAPNVDPRRVRGRSPGVAKRNRRTLHGCFERHLRQRVPNGLEHRGHEVPHPEQIESERLGAERGMSGAQTGGPNAQAGGGGN
jgi:hypothetical protein